MLPTNIKFKVSSYVKSSLSNTQENFGLKTRHLKGIITEQLFIMSIKSLFEEKVFKSLLCLFYFIGTKHIKENYHTIFYFILLQEMLKGKMKRKDTYLYN
jgi:hypothetical protein